jgi:hypothetical protein
VHRADNLNGLMRQLSRNSGNLNLLEPSGTVQACKGLFTFTCPSLLAVTVVLTSISVNLHEICMFSKSSSYCHHGSLDVTCSLILKVNIRS